MFIFDVYEKWQKIIVLFKVNATFSWFSIKAMYLYRFRKGPKGQINSE